MELGQEIVDNLKKGDESAFKLIFDKYYKPLVRYAYTFLKDKEEAEDEVQRVFIALWEKRSALEIHSSMSSFLYRSVQNASLNRIKQKKVRSEYAKEVQGIGNKQYVDEVLQAKELEKKIEKALGVLPEQCAKVFKLSRFEQLKYQQIADELGISIKTVENQMGKALKILREQLKEYLYLFIILILSQY